MEEGSLPTFEFFILVEILEKWSTLGTDFETHLVVLGSGAAKVDF